MADVLPELLETPGPGSLVVWELLHPLVELTRSRRPGRQSESEWAPKLTASARCAIWGALKPPCRLIPFVLVLVSCFQVFSRTTCTVICPVKKLISICRSCHCGHHHCGALDKLRERTFVCVTGLNPRITSNFSVRVDIFRFREKLVSSHPRVINSDFPPPIQEGGKGPFTGFHRSRTP